MYIDKVERAKNVIRNVIYRSALDLCTYRRVMAAGKMKPIRTAAVAPVNWKASQMLGMKFAAAKMTAMSPTLREANLVLSEVKGLASGKRRPSKFSRSG